jgi:hypothetical protein
MACPHGFPKPASCVECMEDGGLPPAPRERVFVEHVTTSRYDGQCPECNLPIRVGQRIARLSTEAWVHEPCAP